MPKHVHFSPGSFYKKRAETRKSVPVLCHHSGAPEAPVVIRSATSYQLRTGRESRIIYPESEISDVESFDDETTDSNFNIDEHDSPENSTDSESDESYEVDEWLKEHLMKTTKTKIPAKQGMRDSVQTPSTQETIPSAGRCEREVEDSVQTPSTQETIPSAGRCEREVEDSVQTPSTQETILSAGRCEREVEDSVQTPSTQETILSAGRCEREVEDSVQTPSTQETIQSAGSCEREVEGKVKYACPFCCKTLAGKIRRHLLTKQHEAEPDLLRIKALTKVEQDKEYSLLKNKGIRMFNQKIVESERGHLLHHGNIKDCDAESLKLCNVCQGTYAKVNFYRHKCLGDERSAKRGTILQSQALIDDELVATILEEIQDPLRRVMLRNDPISIKFVQAYASAHDMKIKARETLRGKLNLLARVMLGFREETSNPDARVADMIRPAMFQHVIQVTRNLAKLTPDGLFGAPSNARAIGILLSECAQILECEANQDNDIATMDSAIRFQALYDKGWKAAIGGKAHLFTKDSQRNKDIELPLVDDIRRISDHLKKQISDLEKELTTKVTCVTWRALAEAVLSYLILFNKRRVTEVSTMTLSDYAKLKTSLDKADDDLGLSQLEKDTLQSFYRVELCGKRHNKVPIMMKKDIKKCLDLLIQTREIADVCSENKYVFSLTKGSKGYIRGDKVLKDAADSVSPPLQHSDRIRSTKLRKHIATMSQILDMTSAERENLASYLGHSLQVHAHYYKLPLRTLQTAKLGGLFEALDRGSLSSQAGLPLGEMRVNHDGGHDVDINPGPSSVENLQGGHDADINPGPSSVENLQGGHDADISSGPSSPENLQGGHDADISPGSSSPENRQGGHDADSSPGPSSLENLQGWQEAECPALATSKPARKSRVKRPWTQSENEAITQHFHSHVVKGKIPSVEHIKAALSADKRLSQRCPGQIRAKLNNDKKKAMKHFV